MLPADVPVARVRRPHAASCSRMKTPRPVGRSESGGVHELAQKPASMPRGVPSVWNAPGKNPSEWVMLATIGEELLTVMP